MLKLFPIKKSWIIAFVVLFFGSVAVLYYYPTWNNKNNKLSFNHSVLVDPSLPRLIDIARSNINNLSEPFKTVSELARALVRLGKTDQALNLAIGRQHKEFIFGTIVEELIHINELDKAKQIISQNNVSSMSLNESLAVTFAETGDIVSALRYINKITFKPARNILFRRLLKIRFSENRLIKQDAVATHKLIQELPSLDERINANILVAKILFVGGKLKQADTLFAQIMKMIQSSDEATAEVNIDFAKPDAYTRVLAAQVSLGRLNKGHEINKRFLNSEKTVSIIYALLKIHDTQNAFSLIQGLNDNRLKSRLAYALLRKQLELNDMMGAKDTAAIITSEYYRSLAYLQVALSLAKNKNYKQAKRFIEDSEVIIKSLVDPPYRYDAYNLLIQAYVATDQRSVASLTVQKNIDLALASGQYTQVLLRDFLIQQCNIYDMPGALTTFSHITQWDEYIQSLDSIVEAYAAHGEIDKALEMAKLIPDTRKFSALTLYYKNKALSGEIMDIYRSVKVDMLGERHSDLLYSIVTTQARKGNVSDALKTIMRLENNDDRIRSLVGIIDIMSEKKAGAY